MSTGRRSEATRPLVTQRMDIFTRRRPLVANPAVAAGLGELCPVVGPSTGLLGPEIILISSLPQLPNVLGREVRPGAWHMLPSNPGTPQVEANELPDPPPGPRHLAPG